MSSIKISQLTQLAPLNSNTANVLFVVTDSQLGVTGIVNGHTVSDGLFANNPLNVGNNSIQLPNTVAQFVWSGQSYVQTNFVNSNDGGSADMVVTANTGSDSTYFIDFGYANKDYQPGSEFNNIGTAVNRLDGYIYAQGSPANTWGGNLIVGSTTTGKEIRFIAGGGTAANVVARMNASAIVINQGLVFPDGSLQVTSPSAASSYANSAFALANVLVGIENTQNTNIGLAWNTANGAFTTANNALANTSGTFAGNLFITGRANVGQQVVVANSTYDYTNTALMRITGSAGGVTQPPANPGYMLYITGVDGVASRIINTGYGTGAYGLYAARHANGTAASPTAAANNDVLGRFSGAGFNGTSFTSTGQARIDVVAEEDFTTANNGTRIEFYNTIPKTNTITKIATFNANTVTFTGSVNPQKGFIYSPKVYPGAQTAFTIDFSTDSVIRSNTSAGLTISFTNYSPGKVVKMWITNTAGTGQTFTHGCTALNSTVNATTYTIPSTSTIAVEYISFNGDLANTFCSIIHA